MEIKIPSDPPGAGGVDALDEAGQSVAGSSETQGDPAAAEISGGDPVSRIAEQVAAVEISRDQAIEQLLSQTLDLNIVKAAPREAVAGLEEALRALIDTHPHLKSLGAFLGPSDQE
jgi:hypothetical protein